MNKRQKIVVIVGVLVIVGMCVFPPQLERLGGKVRSFGGYVPSYRERGNTTPHPIAAAAEPVRWEYAGYGLFWATGRKIDLGRLGVQVFAAVVLTVGLALMLVREKAKATP